MNCDKIEERMVAALDEGIEDSLVEQHCLTCPRCSESRASYQSLFLQLDSLPTPSFASGDAFVQTLSSTPTSSIQSISTWETLCALVARRPAFGIGLALLCVFIGSFVFPGWKGLVKEDQNSQSIQILTEEITVLNESLAVLQLQRVSASERLRGVGWIQDHGDVNQDLIRALQLVLDSDDNVNVRLAAIDALARFSDDPSARQCLIQSLEKPQSPLVRIALIEKLVPLDEPASKEAFRAIVADEKAHEAVRARARSAIELSTQEPV